MLVIPQRSELALRRRRVQLPAEREPHRSKDDRYVLGRRSSLIAPEMPFPGIDVSLALGDHLGRASRIVALVERHFAFDHGDEDRPWMGMPPR